MNYSRNRFSSRNEKIIQNALQKEGFNFKKQYFFSDCLSELGFPLFFDFGILNKLHEEEYIYQENKHKYFICEEKGILEAERLIEKYNINKD